MFSSGRGGREPGHLTVSVISHPPTHPSVSQIKPLLFWLDNDDIPDSLAATGLAYHILKDHVEMLLGKPPLLYHDTNSQVQRILEENMVYHTRAGGQRDFNGASTRARQGYGREGPKSLHSQPSRYLDQQSRDKEVLVLLEDAIGDHKRNRELDVVVRAPGSRANSTVLMAWI